jgi:cell division protein FtsQ
VRLRIVAAIVAVLVFLGGAWLWLRDSSLVAVRRVTVTGVSGPDASQIRSVLIATALDMTTLDVQMSQLNTVVAPYPVVKALSVSTQFPHGMRIRVTEQVPVAIVVAGTIRTAVAADGTLLRAASVTASLPTVAVPVEPGGTRLTGPTLGVVRLLGAAPYALLAKVQAASVDPDHGLVAQMRNGPSIYFGGGGEAAQKWMAAALVMGDPGSAGASYIDVTDPRRPAAGAGKGGG